MYFTARLFEFFRDLKAHNDRDWFLANKARYVADVEDPMLAFIGDFAPRLREISVAFVADRRKMGGSMFRIHRDTRFSPDKAPYKTWAAARFAHETRKQNPSVPTWYLHLGLDHNFGGGGLYHVERAELTRVRQQIVDQPREWAAATRGIEVRGEQLKRAPAGFPATHEHLDDLKRRSLYAMLEFPREVVTANDFLDRYTDACARVTPLLEFQTRALGLRW